MRRPNPLPCRGEGAAEVARESDQGGRAILSVWPSTEAKDQDAHRHPAWATCSTSDARTIFMFSRGIDAAAMRRLIQIKARYRETTTF